MTDRTLADLPRNGRETLRVRLSEFKGSQYADIRIFAAGTEGEALPTKQGATIRPAQLRQVIDALLEAERVFISEGKMPEARS